MGLMFAEPAKCFPFLLQWHVEAAVDGVMANPRIRGVSDSVTAIRTGAVAFTNTLREANRLLADTIR
jgi:hypothetical protein